MLQLLKEKILRAVATRRFQFALLLTLSLKICLSASAIQNVPLGSRSVSLGWDASQTASVAGYSVFYGTVSGTYTSEVDAGTNLVAVVSGLTEGSTYYFVVTSYDTNGAESVPSNEISYTVPVANDNPPTLAPVADQTVNVGQSLVITNSAVGADGSADNLSFSLISAPAGMRINPTNGVLSWTPSMAQAGSSNLVIEQVSDTNTPPLISTQTFAVEVGNAVQTSIDSAVVSVGQTGGIVLTLTASGPVAGLMFTLDAPAGWVSALTVQALAPENLTIRQIPPGATHSTIVVEAPVNEVFQGQVQLQINLSAATNQQSSFGTLQVSSMAAFTLDGSQIPTTPPASSRLVFVGADSLMDLHVNAGVGKLTVYGPAGASYQIQSTTNLSSGGGWTNEFSTTLTNLFQSFPNLPADGAMKFYRARRL
jgi:hypothetical protein